MTAPAESAITEEQFAAALEEEAAWRALGLALCAVAADEGAITEEQFMAMLEEASFAVCKKPDDA